MSILVDESTTFIIQGITGREAVNMTRECLDYGSKVLGGVTGGSPDTLVHFTRGAFAVAFGLTLVLLLRRTLRSPPGKQ